MCTPIGPRELLADQESTSFTVRVQFEFNLDPARPWSADGFLALNGRRIPLALVCNRRARRYVLRMRPDGSARVTIPRGGSTIDARRFVERNRDWFERQLRRLSARPSQPKEWSIGTEILFRGEIVRIEPCVTGKASFPRDSRIEPQHCDLLVEAGVTDGGAVRFAGEIVRVTDTAADLRPAIERHLWKLAAQELPLKVLHFAAAHQLPVHRITVRNQRSRWGSCSRLGTISLNWRLIQAPSYVQDYSVLHELCHLREMNHSARFWAEVERVCPDYEASEKWLKQHSNLLR